MLPVFLECPSWVGFYALSSLFPKKLYSLIILTGRKIEEMMVERGAIDTGITTLE
jgi:hypothetical protein